MTIVDKRTFAAAPNSAYSVALTGSLPEPTGKSLFKSRLGSRPLL
jgi:hypothetical protein